MKNLMELQDWRSKFVQIIKEKDQSILILIKCISVIVNLRKQLQKPLSQLSKEDVKALF